MWLMQNRKETTKIKIYYPKRKMYWRILLISREKRCGKILGVHRQNSRNRHRQKGRLNTQTKRNWYKYINFKLLLSIYYFIKEQFLLMYNILHSLLPYCKVKLYYESWNAIPMARNHTYDLFLAFTINPVHIKEKGIWKIHYLLCGTTFWLVYKHNLHHWTDRATISHNI